VNEQLVYFLFSLALSAAITVAIGRNFVAEHGWRVIPVLVVIAVCAGLLLGWALDGFINYVRVSAEIR
jgi:uncharacterized membrane protein YciS (DUF1049 family)